MLLYMVLYTLLHPFIAYHMQYTVLTIIYGGARGADRCGAPHTVSQMTLDSVSTPAHATAYAVTAVRCTHTRGARLHFHRHSAHSAPISPTHATLRSCLRRQHGHHVEGEMASVRAHSDGGIAHPKFHDRTMPAPLAEAGM